jgi:hypothetical protein
VANPDTPFVFFDPTSHLLGIIGSTGQDHAVVDATATQVTVNANSVSIPVDGATAGNVQSIVFDDVTGDNSLTLHYHAPANALTVTSFGSLSIEDGALNVLGDLTIFASTDVRLSTTLSATGSIQFFSQGVDVANGGTLAGSATVSSALEIEAGGTLAPGSSPGVIQARKITFDAGSFLQVEVGPGGAGQLMAKDGIDLRGAALATAATSDFTTTAAALTLATSSAGTILGPFDNLAEGDAVVIGGEAFRISYQRQDDSQVELIPAATVAIGGVSPDTGVSATDGITSANRPTVFGTATPGTQVTVVVTGDSPQGSPLVLGTTTVNADGTWQIEFPEDTAALSDGVYTVTATDQGGAGDQVQDTSSITVDATAPKVVVAPVTGQEGTSLTTVVATFTVGGAVLPATSYKATIVWGDGHTSDGLITSDPLGGFDVSGTNLYATAGDYPLMVTVTDAAGNQGSNTGTAMIANVVPVVSSFANVTTGVGTPFSASGFFTDPGADTWTVTVNYGDGSKVQTLTATADKHFSFQHAYSAENVGYTVTVTVTDNHGGSGSTSFVVSVFPSGFQAVSTATVKSGDTVSLVAPDGSTTVVYQHKGTGDTTISLATFIPAPRPPDANPNDPTLLDFTPILSIDFRVSGAGIDEADITFQLPPGTDPNATLALMYVTADGKLVPVLGAGGAAPVVHGNTATVTLNSKDSSPLLSQLGHTVFTIGVVTPTTPAPTDSSNTGSTNSSNTTAATSTPTATIATAVTGPATAAVVTLPPTTTTVTLSPSLALLPALQSSTNGTGDAGSPLSRSVTFVADTQLSFALTSSQDRQVLAVANGGTEDSNAPPDGGVRGVAGPGGSRVPNDVLWELLKKTVDNFWPWGNLGSMLKQAPAAPVVVPAVDGVFLGPLDNVLTGLADADEAVASPEARIAALDTLPALSWSEDRISAGWLLPAALLGLGAGPALHGRDRSRRSASLAR